MFTQQPDAAVRSMNSCQRNGPAGALGRFSLAAVRVLLLAVVAVVWVMPQNAAAQAPRVINPLDDLTLTIGTGPHVVDLRDTYWGAPEECVAESSDESVATAEVEGGYDLLVTPVGIGMARITATASNEDGSVQHGFDVEVVHVAPEAVGAFPDHEMRVGDVLPLELSGAFRGEALEYAASSSDEEAATVSVSGSTASITAHKAGMATITVTATNTGGSAEQKVALRILDVPPEAVGELPDLTIRTIDDPTIINLGEAFTGTALMFSGTSSAEQHVDVSVDGYMATITAVSPGTATVTLTATNSEGMASHVFMVTVKDDRPKAVGMLPDLTITVGGRSRGRRCVPGIHRHHAQFLGNVVIRSQCHRVCLRCDRVGHGGCRRHGDGDGDGHEQRGQCGPELRRHRRGRSAGCRRCAAGCQPGYRRRAGPCRCGGGVLRHRAGVRRFGIG